jgi:hypothetical protein
MTSIDEARIREALTLGGAIPDGYAFLVDSAIYAWNPDTHFQRLLIRPDELAQSCRHYLRVRGRVFPTLPDAATAVIRERWSQWEKLLPFSGDQESAAPRH